MLPCAAGYTCKMTGISYGLISYQDTCKNIVDNIMS